MNSYFRISDPAEDRARFRNRAHKLVDRAGLRVGGVLSDIFGKNGRRILDGLAEGLPTGDILAGPASHVTRKRSDLEGVLSLELHPHARAALKDLLDQHDRAARVMADCERALHSELAKNREDAQSLRLLQTIPGIGAAAAGAILAELGPDIGMFVSHAHCAAWAGLCPGNGRSVPNGGDVSCQIRGAPKDSFQTYWSDGRATRPPIEEVAATIVFDVAFADNQRVGARSRPAELRHSQSKENAMRPSVETPNSGEVREFRISSTKN